MRARLTPRLLPLAVAAWMAAGPAPAAAFTLFSVGSGDITGGYFEATRAICEVVNRSDPEAMRCSPEPTIGSLYNLAALGDGQLDFALAQSDWQKAAKEGSDAFARRGPMPGLRSVMALYAEPVTVLVRRDANVARFDDLIGKRLDIGPPASGRRGTINRLIESLGVRPEQFSALVELPTSSAITELCAGRIDATVLIVGHPNAAIARALETCDISLLPVEGPAIVKLISESLDYSPAVIPEGTYPGLTADVRTFSVIATMVTTEAADPVIVDAIVRDTLANLPLLAIRAPVLANLNPAEMRGLGLTAPLHPAAAQAFSDYFQAPAN